MLRFLAVLLFTVTLMGRGTPAAAKVLDDFDDASAWQPIASNQVSAHLRSVDGIGGGKALCLDYDFNGVSGYAGLRRSLPLRYPDNYEFSFAIGGASPANDLQFKLIDASGDNVWWVNRPAFTFSRSWKLVHYRKRQISKAWGPDPDPQLRQSRQVEFTVYNRVGGKGSVCFDKLALRTLPAEDHTPYLARVSTDTAPALEQRIVDGNPDSYWLSGKAREQTVTLDLGKPRELGGVIVQWVPGLEASRYSVSGSVDGRAWTPLRQVVAGAGGTDWLALPDTEARYLRFDLADGPNWRYGIREIAIQPLEFADTPNDFIRSLAKLNAPGTFPRGFSGQQPYWTLIGLDGGLDQGLVGEDGAIEVGKGGFSIEPFVLVDGKRVGWSDVQARQSLQDDYLPIPSVDWQHPAFGLQVTAFVQGTPQQARLVARYRLSNPGKQARDYVLALAVRPFQVNPPSQFLNTVGGISRIERLAIADDTVSVNGKPRVFALQAPDAGFVTPFDAGMAAMHLAEPAQLPASHAVVDATGLASGALLYRWHLEPGQSREVDLVVPQTGAAAVPAGFDPARAQRQVAATWHGILDGVELQLPAAGRPLVATLRTALAHMLISRVGPRLQPGTRSYARSWIRDGAMISEGLLRLGRADAVRDYLAWYAPFQFADGMVPCCVDDRGADPVPENDSHGELIHAIAEYGRYTGDQAVLASLWPHAQAAWGYMERLRQSERNEEVRARAPAFYGLLPASISHEGYSAKPVHAYWDDFWALAGYRDMVDLADALQPEAVLTYAGALDTFRRDLSASLAATVSEHGLDYLPGSAELGDFDPTSTTVALSPGGEQAQLPASLLQATYQRYWDDFVARRDGQRKWKDYTPYEWRNVGAFVRLGWRERAWQAAQFFLADRQPQAWNQWAEVVSSTPRLPFFLGDLPHAWVASDFVRAALDLFAYERSDEGSLVLAAGVPPAWLDGDGIAVQGLHTPYGTLDYRLRRKSGQLRLDIAGGLQLQLPPAGLLLPWPYPTPAPASAQVNGETVALEQGMLRIQQLPARVVLAVDDGHAAQSSPAPLAQGKTP